MLVYSAQAWKKRINFFLCLIPLFSRSSSLGHTLLSGKQLRASVLTSVQLCGDTAMKNALCLMGKCEVWNLPGRQVCDDIGAPGVGKLLHFGLKHEGK